MNCLRWTILAVFFATLLAGCQGVVAPMPIDATYDMPAPPVEGEFTTIEDKCLLPLQAVYEFTGTIEGAANLDFKILHDGPCVEDMQFGMYDESWIVTGSFEGAVDGREGTFDLFYIAELKADHFTGQMVAVPNSGTGELTNLRAIINFDEMLGDAPPWPVTGYYYFLPMTAP